MKRRDFLNLTAGSAVAAMAPFPGIASPAVTQAPRNLYVWAVAMARAGNPISTDTLGKALKVSSGEATALINKLVTRGVVGAPNALGVARASNPVFKSSGIPVTNAPTATAQDARAKVQRFDLSESSESVSDETETDPPENPESASLTTLDGDCGLPEASDATRSTE